MRIDVGFLQSIDWSKTPLGAMESWPRSLKSYVSMILGLPTPAIVFWGPEQTQIYNDGYAVIMGPRHPRFFGAPYRECWPDTYPVIMPWMRAVLDEGKTIEVAEAPFTLTRHGFTEEAYFTFTFSPLRDDDDRIAGVYQPVVEVTDAVLRARRADTLRLLSLRHDALLPNAMQALERNRADLPFAAIFLADEGAPRLAASFGFASISDDPERRARAWAAVARAVAENEANELGVEVVAEPWPEPVRSAVVIPVRRSPSDAPLAALMLGVSPRLRYDARYREFFEAIAREIGASLAGERAEAAERAWREREDEQRREAARVKEAQARRLSALFEHAPVGIAVLRGPDHVFEVANRHYSELLGHRPLLQKPLREAIPELAGQGIFELVGNVYRTGEPYVGRAVRLVVDDARGKGEERYFDFLYQGVPSDDGGIESVIVVVFEVTELSRARRDAEAASRAKDEFFAILGHELRNPLAPITTALHLMKLRGDAGLTRERTIIERQVEQITRLVDDLLDVSRMTRGKVTLKREPVEIAEVVAKAIEMTSPLLEQRQHAVELDVAPEGLVVDGDASRLAQVVANLLTNAAKYTEPRGHVRVAAERREGSIVLRVQDDGIGLAADMLPRIFEPFAQEKQSLDRAQGGLGLGLTIVANLVKLHGGTVTAHSAGRGRGATFAIDLPIAASAPEARPVGAASAVRSRAPNALRVMVVDDNVDAAEMLVEALSTMGHESRVAHDAAEALRLDAAFAPDVALLDIGLPVMDGYELAGRLRAVPRSAPLLLIAVTGYGQDSDRRRAIAAGFDAHLVKPVRLETVEELIAAHPRDGHPRDGHPRQGRSSD